RRVDREGAHRRGTAVAGAVALDGLDRVAALGERVGERVPVGLGDRPRAARAGDGEVAHRVLAGADRAVVDVDVDGVVVLRGRRRGGDVAGAAAERRRRVVE